MEYDPPDQARLNEIRSAAEAGYNPSPQNQAEGIAADQGRAARARQQMFNEYSETIRHFPIGPQPRSAPSGEGPASKIVGFLMMLVLVGTVWGWFTIRPSIEDFFNRHYTDPWSATWLAQDALKHRSYAEARYWFEIGASHGNTEAQFNLGLLYARGLGGPARRAEASMWIKRAAGGGYGPARAWLAKKDR
jgi:TPR repeat protein